MSTAHVTAGDMAAVGCEVAMECWHSSTKRCQTAICNPRGASGPTMEGLAAGSSPAASPAGGGARMAGEVTASSGTSSEQTAKITCYNHPP